MSRLHLILYASRMTPATRDALEGSIRDILSTAKRRNAESEITGILIAHSGWFIQALEGAQDAVRERFRAISKDPRHQELVVLGEGPILARVFGAWSMCSSILSDTDRMVLDLLGKKASFDPLTYPAPKVFQVLTTVANVHRSTFPTGG